MTQSAQDPSAVPIDNLAVCSPVRRPAKLLGAVIGAVAALALLGFVLWGTRDERPTWTTPAQPWLSEAAPRNEDEPSLRGRLVYQAHCARCHGEEGHGDGPAVANSQQRPRDLASASWRSGAVENVVRRVIAEGTPDKAMPGSAGVISTSELDAVVDYVLSLEITAALTHAGLSPEADRIAPRLSFRGADGTLGSLEQLRGKFVLVAFWGTTCAPCLEELPDLEQLAARYDKTKFVVLPLCIDGSTWETARDVAARHAPELPVFVDSDGSVRKNYFVGHLPQTDLVDPNGRMLARCFGARRWASKQIYELCEACVRAAPPVDP